MYYNNHQQSQQQQSSSAGPHPSLILGPAKHTTVVTTTTTTTTTYAPIVLPRPSPPPSLKDPKLYPLLNAPLPRSLRKFPLIFPGGTRAMFQDPSGSDDEEADVSWVEDEVPRGEGWNKVSDHRYTSGKDKDPIIGLPDALDRFSARKRVHSESTRGIDATAYGTSVGDVVMGNIIEGDPGRSPPPRKKARAADPPIQPSSSRAHGGPPSPLPSPQPSPTSAVLWAPNPSAPATSQAPPLQPDISLTTLLALPDMLNQYVALPPTLQAHYLFTLLRHSPLSVLRTVHSVLGPTLARDFVGMLPPELSSYILQFLTPSSLFAAARVSRSWRQTIDSDPVLWMSLMRRTGTWFGGASEATFTQKVEEYRARHPITSRRDIASALTPPHPLKLLFKSRRTILSRWTQKTPKRLTFAAHGASVVTCLLFSRRRIISASDDHSIHIYDPTDGSQIRMLEGHDGGVWALAVCSRRIDSRGPRSTPEYHDILVSGSTDRTVRIWDLSTGRNTHVFGGHTSTVRCLAIVRPTWIEREDGSGIKEKWPKRTLIVTGSRDHTLRVWRLPGRRDDEYKCKGSDAEDDAAEEDVSLNPFHLRLLEGHAHAVRALAAHGRTLVSGSYDATVRVWDIITGECRFILIGHTQKVYSVVLDPVRQQCCSGSMDGSVRIWSLKTGQNLHVLTGHSSLVGLLSLSPTTLVSAAADSTLRIWNPDTGASQHVLQAHQGAITCFQHDEFKVLSGSDGALKMWDARDGTVVRDLLTNILGVWQVVFDERYCVAASNLQDHTYLDVWDFGDEGEADVEAARIVEDEDESDSEEEYDSFTRPRQQYGSSSITTNASASTATHIFGNGMVINEDEEDEEEARFLHEDAGEDEDSTMADATSASASTSRHTHHDMTPIPSDHDHMPEGIASPLLNGASPSHQAGGSGGSWNFWQSSSMSPTPFGNQASNTTTQQTFSSQGESQSQVVGGPSNFEASSSVPGPSIAAGLAATRRLSRARSASGSDPKGKGRAVFATTNDAGAALGSGSGSSGGGALGLGLGFGIQGARSPLHAHSDTTPPTSSIGNVAPPSIHGWVASSYTIQGAQRESEDSPSKNRARRHGR